MKKYISFILCVLFLFMAFGCQRPNSASVQPVPLDTIQKFYEAIEKAPEVKAIKPTVAQGRSLSVGRDLNIRPCYQVTVTPFERDLNSTTDIVKATHITTKDMGTDYVMWHNYCHVFELIESVSGSITSSTIYVIDHAYYVPMRFEKGEDYLIFLKRYRDVCVQDDLFAFSSMARIPLDENRDADIDNAIMVDSGMPLKDVMVEERLKEATENGRFIEEIAEMMKSVYYDTNVNFIDSNDPMIVLSNSPNVVSITVGEADESRYDTFYMERYACKVTYTLKGDVEDDIFINLPSYFVKQGDRYVIALSDAKTDLSNGDIYYTPSSQYSIFDITQAEHVKSMLEDLG